MPAVRGAIAIKSAQYSQQLAEGNSSGLPFDKIYQCNIGNPQILGQASALRAAAGGAVCAVAAGAAICCGCGAPAAAAWLPSLQAELASCG